MVGSTAAIKPSEAEAPSAQNIEDVQSSPNMAVSRDTEEETLAYGRTGVMGLFDSRFVFGAALLAFCDLRILANAFFLPTCCGELTETC